MIFHRASLVSLAKVPPTSPVPVPVPVPVSVPARTLPYLIYSLLIYLPTYCMQEPAENHSFIHFLTPSLPPGCRLGICLYLYLSAYLSVCMYIHTIPLHTHKRYISKIHIKDTCTRVSWGMWLFLILKTYLPIRSTQKTTRRTSVHPPRLSQLHSVNLCANQSKISLSNWRPKTTVCLASYLR